MRPFGFLYGFLIVVGPVDRIVIVLREHGDSTEEHTGGKSKLKHVEQTAHKDYGKTASASGNPKLGPISLTVSDPSHNLRLASYCTRSNEWQISNNSSRNTSPP
jgi:hypothetical protein